MLDFIIHNATILPMTENLPVWESGWIGIQNGIITEISPTTPTTFPAAKEMINGQKGIVLPGLINAHTHLPMSLFRGVGPDVPLQKWLKEYIFPAEAKFITPESVFVGTQLSCAEMLLGGITTCCDGYFYEDHIAKAVEQSGMRAILGQSVLDFPIPGVLDMKDILPTSFGFVEKWIHRCDRILPSIFCHAPYTCSIDTLKKAKAFTRQKNVLFQIHVSETKSENDIFFQEHGLSPIEMLYKNNLLDPQTLLIHSVWLSDQDISYLSQANASIVHCPESNMKLSSGIMPFESLCYQNVTLAIGTDGCASNNNQDLFGEMDVAAKLHKVSTGDPTVANAGTILSMATRTGAKALGLDHLIGTLEKGKQADLILVSTQAPHMLPMYDPISHIVYTATASDVDSVFIQGNPIVRHRQLLTINLEKLFDALVPISNEIRQFITSL